VTLSDDPALDSFRWLSARYCEYSFENRDCLPVAGCGGGLTIIFVMGLGETGPLENLSANRCDTICDISPSERARFHAKHAPDLIRGDRFAKKMQQAET
jgi:hypothetical protein